MQKKELSRKEFIERTSLGMAAAQLIPASLGGGADIALYVCAL